MTAAHLTTIYSEFQRRVGFSLAENQLLLTLTGSHAYGLNTPTSDYDYFAVALPPFARSYGLFPWTDFCPEANSLPGPADIKVYSVRRYIELLRKGNFNVVETLFFTNKTYHSVSPLLTELFLSRDAFLTQHLVSSILGFANAEVNRLTKQELNKDVGQRRRELFMTYGYDPKAISRMLHLLLVAEEVVRTGTMRPNMPEHNDMLMEIKRGEWPWEDVSILSNKLLNGVGSLDRKALPKEAPIDLCNELLFQIEAKFYLEEWLSYAN